MAEGRFYRCEEVRCPRCGEQLKFLKADKNEPLLVQHPNPKPRGERCPASGKKSYAAPLVVELTEFGES
jgi:hypothetical protein